jgi:HEAT repeat protein
MIPVLCVLALLRVVPAAAQDVKPGPDEKKIRALVEKLDADEPDARSQAERELSGMDETIVPLLEKARGGAGAEVRSRLDRVIGELTLARRWVKDLSGEEGEAQQAYVRLDAAIRTKTLDRRQAVRVLNAVILSPAVADTHRQNLISLAERSQIIDIWPSLVDLLSREDQETGYVLGTLQRMRLPKEASDEILKAIPRMKNRPNLSQIFELLVRLKAERSKLDPVIQALLDDADESSAYTIANQLSSGRIPVSLKTALKLWNGKQRNVRQSIGREAVLRIPPDESVKEVLDLLGSADWEEITLAADYVARHRVRQAAAQLVDGIQKQSVEDRARRDLASAPGARRYYYPGSEPSQVRARLIAAFRVLGPEDLIKEWLASGGPPPRAALVGLIGELDLRALAGEVVSAVEDKDAAVRQAAARALAGLPHPDAAKKLEGLLKDENVPVRRAALQSLAQVKGAAATPIVLEQLRSDNPDVQAMAVEVLPAMNLDTVLDELTRESTLGVALTKYALAALVAYHGDSLLHRVMARAGAKVSADELQSMIRLIQAAHGGFR